MTRRALLGAGMLLLAACGASHKKVDAPTLPPANPQAVSQMVQGVRSAKDASSRDHAIALLRNAVTADPGLWEAHYNLGILLADKGDLKPAERELSDAAKLAPNAEDVAVALSEVRRRQGDPSGGIDALESFVKQNPDAKVASIALVTALREGGRVKEAIEQAQRVLVYHSSDPYALSELALANMEQDEVDTAELLIEEALKADDKSAVVERAAGLISLRKGEDAVAFKHFQRASELDPKDTTARLNTGTVLLQAGVYDKAAQEFRAVLEVEPESIDAMLGLAAARRGQGKREDQSGYLEAEKLLKGVLEREPENLDATFNLGILYSDYLKRPNDATPLLRRFLDDAPKTHPGRAEAERLVSGAQTQKK
ncbi:MAG TPA: tetratricopeptide repeat protein [Polyangiaceae bacterium]|jgi:tetratricopeptide (TPR) repeat protein|nr:tetratricopeptide repeat protein [Polyangiaceae bacterium]